MVLHLPTFSFILFLLSMARGGRTAHALDRAGILQNLGRLALHASLTHLFCACVRSLRGASTASRRCSARHFHHLYLGGAPHCYSTASPRGAPRASAAQRAITASRGALPITARTLLRTWRCFYSLHSFIYLSHYYLPSRALWLYSVNTSIIPVISWFSSGLSSCFSQPPPILLIDIHILILTYRSGSNTFVYCSYVSISMSTRFGTRRRGTKKRQTWHLHCKNVLCAANAAGRCVGVRL